MELKTVYDVMEEKLQGGVMDTESIKQLGFQLLEKIKLIDEEISVINCYRDVVDWNLFSDDEKKKMTSLYSLKVQYRSQFDVITIILGNEKRIVRNFTKDKFKQLELSDKFFVIDLE